MIEAVLGFIFNTVAKWKRKALQRAMDRDPTMVEYIHNMDRAAAAMGVSIKRMEDATINNPEWVRLGSQQDEQEDQIVKRTVAKRNAKRHENGNE